MSRLPSWAACCSVSTSREPASDTVRAIELHEGGRTKRHGAGVGKARAVDEDLLAVAGLVLLVSILALKRAFQGWSLGQCLALLGCLIRGCARPRG